MDAIFIDGILLIICGYMNSLTIKEIILDGQYDEPLSLIEIERDHPEVRMVIFETPLLGQIFKYRPKDKRWELAGKTNGFA